MEIKTRTLNKGETFCCSFRKAKELFKNTDIVLNFGYTSRTFGTFIKSPTFFYVKNYIKGKVIASMYSYSNKETSLLNFYVVQEALFNENLKQTFEESYLPKFYDFYVNRASDTNLSLKTKVLLIEFVNGTLKQHEFEF